MSDFQLAVEEAKAKLPEKPSLELNKKEEEKPEEKLSPVFRPSLRYNAICTENGEYEKGKWPEYFSIEPKVGHMVEAATEGRLQIVTILHKYYNNASYLVLELGKTRTDVTPISGVSNDGYQ